MGKLHLLGPPRLEVDGTFSDLPLDRPASLGYYLAQRGDWVRRGELAYLYSPEADEASAYGNLRKLIFRLKQQGWAEVESDQNRAQLLLPTDVQEFRAALERQDYQTALQVYSGTFLEGLAFPDLGGYEAWLELERQDLARAWRGAVLEHARALESASNLTEAEQWLARLLHHDPLDEEAIQALLRVLQKADKPVQARAAYESFKRALKRELDAEPLESTRALADALSQPTAVSASTEPRPPRHNLPALTTRFIGRKRELAALARQLLNPDCRLLTFMGLGGMGKTRLALELASQHVESFADGVWLVSLVGVASPDLLVSSINASLGLTSSGPTDPKAQLIHHLQGKELLLVLDNFEHLLEGSLLLEELLAQASGLKLLATSRVALELSSEWLYDLEGLSYPPQNTEEDLDGFDAVRLFTNRAERVSSNFVLSPSTLATIADITRRVQGMPLALELAATWVRSMSLAEIAQMLERPRVLSTHLRDIPERQRSMATVFGHSWARLSSAEQAILNQLSIFQGGFTAAAAEAVAAAHLPNLLKLMNQALVRRSQEGRFDLHELVRQHAQEQARSEPSTWRETEGRFTQYYAGLLKRAWLERGQSHQVSLQRLGVELANIQKAWGLMVQHLEYAHLRDSSQAVFDYFLYFLPPSDGQRFFQQPLQDFLSATPQDPSQHTFCLGKLHQCSAVFEYITAVPSTKAGMEAALECFRAVGSVYEEAYTLNYLGQMEMFAGNYPSAREFLNQALALCHSEQEDLVRAWSLNTLGGVCIFERKLEEAILHLEAAIQLFARLGLLIELNMAKSNLAETQGFAGRLVEARQNLLEIIEFYTRIGSDKFLVTSYLSLSRVYFMEGNFRETIETCNRLKHLKGSYLMMGDPYVYIGPGISYRELGQLEPSVRMLLEGAQSTKQPNEHIEILIELAHSLIHLGERELALLLLRHCRDEAPTQPLSTIATDLLTHFANYHPTTQTSLDPSLRAEVVELVKADSVMG